jgi:hypothetical protein
MLVPLTRKTLERLIPIVATGEQYRYYWGKLRDLLRRLLISIIAVLVVILFTAILGTNGSFLRFILSVVVGLYWFWAPIYQASLRNRTYRRYPYGGLWQGEVLDVYVTEELIGEEETVNKRGDLVVVENRERRLNLIVGDETGFETRLQVPLQRDHKGINLGQGIQMVILSKDPELSRFACLTDAYLPGRDLWISDYPFLQRDIFVDVSYKIQRRYREQAKPLDIDDSERSRPTDNSRRSPSRRRSPRPESRSPRRSYE